MTARPLRSAAGAGLIALIVLTAHGCGALNPALISQVGGSAARSGPQPNGSILIVLNNQTPSEVDLFYQREISRPGEGLRISDVSFIRTFANSYWVVSHDCATTGIIFTTLTVGGVPIPVTFNQFQTPALQCGSIIFVTVQGVGATALATAELF